MSVLFLLLCLIQRQFISYVASESSCKPFPTLADKSPSWSCDPLPNTRPKTTLSTRSVSTILPTTRSKTTLRATTKRATKAVKTSKTQKEEITRATTVQHSPTTQLKNANNHTMTTSFLITSTKTTQKSTSKPLTESVKQTKPRKTTTERYKTIPRPTVQQPEYSSKTRMISEGITMICGEDEMTINIQAKIYSHLDPSKFHLKDIKCVSKVLEEGALIQLKSSLNDCGTTVIESDRSVTYENLVRAYEIASPTKGISITRKEDLTLPFNCTYSKEKLVSTLSFEKLRQVDATEGSLGNFTFIMDLFTSKEFITSYKESDYPLSVDLNDPVFVQYKIGSEKGDLHVFAEKCLATTTTSETTTPNYVFLDKGCAIDPTMVYNYSPGNIQNFTINAFRFISDNPVVYLHCLLLVCHSTTKNTKCANGCSKNRAKRDSIPYKQTIESSLYHLASGPITRKQIRLANPTDNQGQESNNLVVIISSVTSFSLVLLVTSIILTICILWKRKRVVLKEPLQLTSYDGDAPFRLSFENHRC